MPKYAAFLRGINVGGNKKVPMAELKKVLEKIGLNNVKTILASGNVIFESSNERIDKLQSEVSTAIEKHFNFTVPVLLRHFSDIDKITKLNPFKDIKVTPQTRLYATFLSEKVKNKSRVNYTTPDKSFNIISVSNDVVFSVLDISISGTPEAMEILEKEFGKNITTRNWNTVIKIAAL